MSENERNAAVLNWLVANGFEVRFERMTASEWMCVVRRADGSPLFPGKTEAHGFGSPEFLRNALGTLVRDLGGPEDAETMDMEARMLCESLGREFPDVLHRR